MCMCKVVLSPTDVLYVCLADRCAPRPDVGNAEAEGFLAVNGSHVNYTCLEGYSLEGGVRAFSTYCDGEYWSHVQPYCAGRWR